MLDPCLHLSSTSSLYVAFSRYFEFARYECTGEIQTLYILDDSGGHVCILDPGNNSSSSGQNRFVIIQLPNGGPCIHFYVILSSI